MNSMITNALMLGGIYLGNKIENKIVRYGLFAGLTYALYAKAKSNGGSLKGDPDGWKFKVNPSMAIDMMFPSMGEAPKMILKNVAEKIVDRINLS